MSTLATGAPGGMTYCIVDKIEATAKTAPKNISKLTNSQNLYRKVSFCTIKSVTLRQRGFSVSRSIVVRFWIFRFFFICFLVRPSINFLTSNYYLLCTSTVFWTFKIPYLFLSRCHRKLWIANWIIILATKNYSGTNLWYTKKKMFVE